MSTASLLIAVVAAVAPLAPPLAAQERPELEVYQKLLVVLAAIAVAVYVLWSAVSRYRSRRRKRM